MNNMKRVFRISFYTEPIKVEVEDGEEITAVRAARSRVLTPKSKFNRAALIVGEIVREERKVE